jgi:hypothetical protein
MRPVGQAANKANLTLAVFGAGGAGCCITAAAIQSHGSWLSGGPPRQLVVVVPDGVAEVGLEHSHALTAAVHNNVAVFQPNQAIESPGGFIWYGPSDAVIKRVG